MLLNDLKRLQMHSKATSTTDWLYLIWRNKFLVFACAIAGSILGFACVSLLPKYYEARVTIRPNSMAAFASFATLIPDASFNALGNVLSKAQQTFLNVARDRNIREAYFLAHRNLFAGTGIDSNRLREIIDKDVTIIAPSTTRDPTDVSTEIRFRYKSGTSGPELLNNYANTLITDSTRTLLAEGRAILVAAKNNLELELAKLREARDLGTKQEILVYRNSLSTAKDAGIDKPMVSSANSSISVINGQLPLYLYGTVVLNSELNHLSSQMGEDLAIKGYANLMASIADYDRKLKLLDGSLGPIMLVAETAYATRAIFPPTIPILLFGFLTGAAFGSFWSYLRSTRSALPAT